MPIKCIAKVKKPVHQTVAVIAFNTINGGSRRSHLTFIVVLKFPLFALTTGRLVDASRRSARRPHANYTRLSQPPITIFK